MGQASNWLVYQLPADVCPTIRITLPRMTQFLIAAAYPLLSKFISLLIVGKQYNLGPDGREVIGIIVHVLLCHHYSVAGTVPFCLAFREQSALPISHLTFQPVQWHFAVQSERYQIEMLLVYCVLTCCCCFDEQRVLFCGDSEMV
jgi:hypothetical protein